MKPKNHFANKIRWVARIVGSFLVVFTVVFVTGSLMEEVGKNGSSPQSSFSLLMIVGFIIWGIALAGLVLALWKEGLGGGISFTCFALMGILNMLDPEQTDKTKAIIAFLIFMIPSLLYIYYWWLNRRSFLPTDDNKEKKSSIDRIKDRFN